MVAAERRRNGVDVVMADAVVFSPKSRMITVYDCSMNGGLIFVFYIAL